MMEEFLNYFSFLYQFFNKPASECTHEDLAKLVNDLVCAMDVNFSFQPAVNSIVLLN